jgi:hypothetical protein
MLVSIGKDRAWVGYSIAIALSVGPGAACSSTNGGDNTTASDSGGGGPDGGSSSSSSSGGGGAEGGSGSGGMDAGSKVGQVIVSQLTSGSSSPYTASAFFESNGISKGLQCAATTLGACQLSACTPAATNMDSNAGTITVTDGATSAVLSTYAATGQYKQVSALGLLNSGDTVSYSAAGGSIPAFTGTVKAPPVVTITAPTTMFGSTLTVDTTKDFTATWTGIAVGMVALQFTDSAGNAAAVCTFPGSDGRGTVPSAGVLDEIKVLSRGMGSFAFLSVQKSTVAAGDYQVNLEAAFVSASGKVVYQ